MQDLVWTEHCKVNIPGYQRSWIAVTTPLYDFVPEITHIVHDSQGRWCYSTTHYAPDNSPVQVLTVIKTHTLPRDIPEDLKKRLASAKSYIDNPVVGKNCPEELLGIPAVGKSGKRAIPTDRLERTHGLAYGHALIDNANQLEAKVFAKVLGSQSAYSKPLVEVSIRPNWHDPENRTYLLRPTSAELVRSRFAGENDEYEVDIDPDDLTNFLREQAEEHKGDYEKLALVGQFITNSIPLK